VCRHNVESFVVQLSKSCDCNVQKASFCGHYMLDATPEKVNRQAVAENRK